MNESCIFMITLQSRRGPKAWRDCCSPWMVQLKRYLCLLLGTRWIGAHSAVAFHGIHQRQEESHLRKNGHVYCDQLTLASDFLPVSPFPMNRGAVGLEDSSYLTGRRTSVHAKLYHQEQGKDGCSILDVCFNTINQEERAAKVICVCLWKFQ